MGLGLRMGLAMGGGLELRLGMRFMLGFEAVDAFGLIWRWGKCGFRVGGRNGVDFQVEIGGGDEFGVKARNLGTWKRGLETQPHLVWKVPLQPLGLG